MRLDAQSIKLLLVITPRLGRVISDEEDAFLCKTEKDRIESKSARRGGDRNGVEYKQLPQAETCALLRTLAA
jgi:hypothetical protein